MFSNRQTITKAIAMIIIVVLIGLPITGYSIDRYSTFQNELNKLNEVLTKVYENYAGDIDIEEFIKGAIEGAIETLDDSYTSYMSDEQFDSLMGSVDMNFVGIGIFLEQKNQEIIVVRPIPDSPAYEVGLQADDRIIKVDGEPTAPLLLEQVITLIRGQAGTSVTLTIQRNQEIFDVAITRAAINVPTVIAEWYDGIAHIEILTFGFFTVAECNEIIDQLIAEHGQIDGIILDVRNNSGGRLHAAIELVNIFMKDKAVLTVVEKGQQLRTYNTYGNALEVPVVVLVNHLSASASEILAGAFQDNNRAAIVGTKTFGKGTVQSLLPVESGGYLKVTTAEYFTPNGYPVNGKGITPDIYIEYPIAQLAKGLELLQPSDAPRPIVQVGPDDVIVNGIKATIDAKPYMQDQEVYLPLRFVVEAMGGNVIWNSSTQSIQIIWNEMHIELEMMDLIHPTVKVGDRTYLSLTDFEQVFKIQSSYDSTSEYWNLSVVD